MKVLITSSIADRKEKNMFRTDSILARGMWQRQDSIATAGEKARKDKFSIARSGWDIRSSGLSQPMLMCS